MVAWIQAGVTAYQRLIATGAPMPIPASVEAATAEYFDEEDTLGAWASDCLEEGAEMSATILYASFTASCERLNRKPKSERAVATWLGNHYAKRHTRAGSFYAVCPKA